MSDSLRPHEPQHARPPCPSPTPGKEVKELSQKLNPELLIQVDGGIGIGNAKEVIEAGANVLVAGSAVFNGGDVGENIKALRG